jgi:hypothetical protein
MDYQHKSLIRLLVCALALCAAFLYARPAEAQCFSKELKDMWQQGRYEDALKPLSDCVRQTGFGNNIELDYMLADTMLNIPRQNRLGCARLSQIKLKYKKTLFPVSGRSRGVNLAQVLKERCPFVGVSRIRADAGGTLEIILDISRYWIIVAKHSNKCLDVLSASKDDGATIDQFPCHSEENQQWGMTTDESGYISFVSRNSDKCLDVRGASEDNLANINQYQCHGRNNQKWILLPRGDDYFNIVSVQSGKCLDVLAGSVDDLTKVVQYDCHDGENQMWQIRPPKHQ